MNVVESVGEIWLKADIEFPPNGTSYKSILLKFVRPLVKQAEKAIETFFFLIHGTRENPVLSLHLRLKSCDAKLALEKELTTNYNSLREDIGLRRLCFLHYDGEAGKYGKDGWRVTQRFYEWGSKVAFEIAENGEGDYDGFSPAKLVHCFLNQLGMNYFRESETEFHEKRAKECSPSSTTS